MKKKYTLENKAELTLQIKIIIGRIKKNPKELEYESEDWNKLINACCEYRKIDDKLFNDMKNRMTRLEVENLLKMIINQRSKVNDTEEKHLTPGEIAKMTKLMGPGSATPADLERWKKQGL